MAQHKIHEVEGIGPKFADKLAEHGITHTHHLLEHAGHAAGRKSLADKSGLSEKQLLEWANHVDLMRLNGVGSEYSDLLEAAGVDSPLELSKRNAANLAAKLDEINEAKKLVRSVPNEGTLQKWIDEAATLEKVVHH